MKRSEAIELLRDILDEASGHLAEEVNPEWLLNRIEKKIGMLPPKVEVDNPDYPEFGLSTKYVNTWEPEDEEK